MSGDQFFYLTVNNFQYMDYENVQYRRQTVVVGVGYSCVLQCAALQTVVVGVWCLFPAILQTAAASVGCSCLLQCYKL